MKMLHMSNSITWLRFLIHSMIPSNLIFHIQCSSKINSSDVTQRDKVLYEHSECRAHWMGTPSNLFHFCSSKIHAHISFFIWNFFFAYQLFRQRQRRWKYPIWRHSLKKHLQSIQMHGIELFLFYGDITQEKFE